MTFDWKWTEEKAWAVARGAGIAGVGAVLAYLTQWAGGLDPAYGPAVAAVLMVATNAFRKWATAEQPPAQAPPSAGG